jgi:vacuolar-type H+-ATPase subunit H
MPRFSRRNPGGQLAQNRVSASDQMDTAARVLALAQKTADQAVADAKREAERIISEAHQEADRIIADAHSRAQDVF